MSSLILSAASLAISSGVASLTLTYPSRLAALRAIWPTLPASTTSDRLAAINGLQVQGPPQDVKRSELKKVIDPVRDILLNYASNPVGANPQALLAANYLLAITGFEMTYSETLQTSNPAAFALVYNLGPCLLLDPNTGVTADMLAQMMALITPRVPWWRMNGFSAPVNVLDLASAGNLY